MYCEWGGGTTNLFEVCYFKIVRIDSSCWHVGGCGSRSTKTHAEAGLIHVDKDANDIRSPPK